MRESHVLLADDAMSVLVRVEKQSDDRFERGTCTNLEILAVNLVYVR